MTNIIISEPSFKIPSWVLYLSIRSMIKSEWTT